MKKLKIGTEFQNKNGKLFGNYAICEITQPENNSVYKFILNCDSAICASMSIWCDLKTRKIVSWGLSLSFVVEVVACKIRLYITQEVYKTVTR